MKLDMLEKQVPTLKDGAAAIAELNRELLNLLNYLLLK